MFTYYKMKYLLIIMRMNQVRQVGKLTTEICKALVDEFYAVTEEEICRAMVFLLEGEKTVSEGAGALSVAAVMSGKVSYIAFAASSLSS